MRHSMQCACDYCLLETNFAETIQQEIRNDNGHFLWFTHWKVVQINPVITMAQPRTFMMFMDTLATVTQRSFLWN